MSQIENIILQHGYRGMPSLAKYLPENYLELTAKKILSWPKGKVLIATGFYVAGYAETDGPLGAFALAKALTKLGYEPIIITDKYCQGFFELAELAVEYVTLNASQADLEKILEKYRPVGLIAIERCGTNIAGDYANMSGKSVAAETAPIDLLFDMAYGKIPTVGIGDGGNEIGMGNVQDAIVKELALVPCRTKVDNLVLATVSNWGGYGLVAALSVEVGQKLLPTYAEIEEYLTKIVALGSIDGVLKQHVLSADGFGLDIEKEILNSLANACRFR